MSYQVKASTKIKLIMTWTKVITNKHTMLSITQ